MPRAKVRLRDLVRADRQMRRVLEGRGPDAPLRRALPALACRPVLVGTMPGVGERGCLVFSQGQLVAVLVRLGEGDDAQRAAHRDAHRDAQWPRTDAPATGWFLEAGFGECSAIGKSLLLFGTLREALAWVRRCLGLDTAGMDEALRAALDYAGWLHGDTDRMLAEARAALAAAEQLLAEMGGDPGARRQP